jgi:acetyl esterase/lipase
LRRVRPIALLTIIVALAVIVGLVRHFATSGRRPQQRGRVVSWAPRGCLADLDVAYRGDTPRPHNLLDVVYHRRPVRGGRPAVIIVHGGSWRAGSKSYYRKSLMSALARRGYVAVSISYRLSGVAGFPAAVEDVKAAIRWTRAHARRYDIDPAHIGIWGSSSGAHLAALAAVTSPADGLDGHGPYPDVSSRVQCAVCRSGVYDLRPEANPVASRSPDRMAFLGGSPDRTRQIARRASPVVYLDRHDPPMLIIHGTKDINIPFGAARQMVAAMERAGTPHQFIAVEGGAHSFAAVPGEARRAEAATMSFFDRYLKR